TCTQKTVSIAPTIFSFKSPRYVLPCFFRVKGPYEERSWSTTTMKASDVPVALVFQMFRKFRAKNCRIAFWIHPAKRSSCQILLTCYLLLYMKNVEKKTSIFPIFSTFPLKRDDQMDDENHERYRR